MGKKRAYIKQITSQTHRQITCVYHPTTKYFQDFPFSSLGTQPSLTPSKSLFSGLRIPIVGFRHFLKHGKHSTSGTSGYKCVRKRKCVYSALSFSKAFLAAHSCLYVLGHPDCMGKSPCHCVVGFFVSGLVGESLASFFSPSTLRQAISECETRNTQNWVKWKSITFSFFSHFKWLWVAFLHWMK